MSQEARAKRTLVVEDPSEQVSGSFFEQLQGKIILLASAWGQVKPPWCEVAAGLGIQEPVKSPVCLESLPG